MRDLRGQLPERRPYNPRDLGAIVGVTIHYTDGPTHQTARDIAEFQISPEAASHTGAGEPFPGIAYTILVTGDGVPNLCHDLDRRTWHSAAVVDGRARNATHVGICYTGDVGPNPAQLAGIAEAIAWCQDQLDRTLSVEGHRDPPYATDCPGPRWPAWKHDVLIVMQRPPTWEELEDANPNIRHQRDVWQEARRQVGQDPFSWPAFRSHLMALGAPDPGPRAPADFSPTPGNVAAPTWDELEAENPNIHSQLNQWVLARQALGQDFMDWSAFRAHLIALHAPDPGPAPPIGWSA